MRLAFVGALLSALMLLPATALAEPVREGKVSASAGKFEWDGGPMAGAAHGGGEDCSPPQCEGTLVQVDIPPGSTGKFKVDIDGFGSPVPNDLELYVYQSDASGTPIKLIGASEGAPGSPEAYTIARAATGYYLLQVSTYLAGAAVYHGKVELSGVAVGAPGLPPGTPPSGGDALPASGGLTASISVGPSAPKAAAKAGVPIKVDCSVVCKGSLSVQVSGAQAKKLKLGRKKTTIGKGTIRVDKRNQLVYLKLTKKAAKRVKSAKSVKVTVRGAVTDDAGTQRKTVTANGTLKR